MTDMESPKKNNDCYFYYYSTCAKGDNCTFRHEPSALGCETMCSYWKEGKCLNIHCNFRHMELRKNRKVIPCYWESQPVGCLKAHCPFLHQNPRPTLSGSERTNINAGSSMTMNQQTDRKVTAVDSLVVNFEEESDNESGPSYSPAKNNSRIVKVKTLEEIRLEEIQAEAAAYYSCYNDLPHLEKTIANGDEMRQRIVQRMIINNTIGPERKILPQPLQRKRLSRDELANILGDESLRKKPKIVYQNEDGNFQVVINKNTNQKLIDVTIDEDFVSEKIVKQKRLPDKTDINQIKVKTLAEIRAERIAKLNAESKNEEAEVTSTSEEIPQNVINEPPQNKGKIKIRRKLPLSEPIIASSCGDKTSNTKSNIPEILSEDKLLDLDYEDDDEFDITLKAEEDLLNEVDE